MDFDLTREQERLLTAARDVAGREIAPGAAARDREGRWPADVLVLLGGLGWLGVAVPADHGGAGLDHVGYAIVVEEISAACGGTGAIVSAHNGLFCAPLLAFGTAEQRREILTPAARGREIGAFAAGDVTAERGADGSFTLHGVARLVVAGPAAEHFLVVARTSPAGEEARSTALLVRRGAPGLTVGAAVEMLGIRAAHTGDVVFEGVRVPAAGVVGGEGGGAAVARCARDVGQVGVAAQATGIARAAFAEATAHVSEGLGRAVTMGAPGSAPKPTAPQAIQFLVSDMAVEIDAARLLTLRAAGRLDDRARGGVATRHFVEGGVAKLFASEAAARVTHAAMQVLGAQGYTLARGVERRARDARSTELFEGTSEAQRSAIAAGVLEA